MKRIILPGELIFNGVKRLNHTYVSNSKTYAAIVGMYDEEHGTLIPLEGVWLPNIGENVVGVVASERNSVYKVMLTDFVEGLIILDRYSREHFSVGGVVRATISEVERKNRVILERYGVLKGGILLNIKPVKIPRVIGRGDTMIKQLTDLTGSQIVVGRNGLVWINRGNVDLAISALIKIENEAHTSGLTERIKQMLETNR